MKQLDDFFRYSRERHNVYLKRRDGDPLPWTEDKVIQVTGFTNIYRELDRVTVWFRQNIRDPMRDQPEVVPATLIFRWFNRIATAEAMLPCFGHLGNTGVWDSRWAAELVRAVLPKGPWVTGSYMVHSPYGVNKLDGMLQYCDSMMAWWACEGRDLFFDGKGQPLLTMEEAHRALQPLDGISGFTGYEVVTDLRYTGAIDPRDRNHWAHAGPGATRGGSRVLFGEPDRLSQGVRKDQETLRQLMRTILMKSRNVAYWPQDDPDWPRWEMREVEHTLCEFDKYERVRREQGQAKRKFFAETAHERPLPDALLGGL